MNFCRFYFGNNGVTYEIKLLQCLVLSIAKLHDLCYSPCALRAHSLINLNKIKQFISRNRIPNDDDS